jgi:hypothetical protein
MGGGKTKTHRVAQGAVNMSNEEVLLALETLAQALQIQVRYEKGDFIGGLCRFGEQQALLLQKSDPIHRKIHILARELGTFDLDQLYVLPALRDLIAAELQAREEETALVLNND